MIATDGTHSVTGRRQFASKLSVRFAHGCANLTTERGGFGFHSKTSCFLLSARLRSLSATSCRLLLALLSLNDETRRSPHSLLETMRVCPANSQRLKTWKFLSRTFRIPFLKNRMIATDGTHSVTEGDSLPATVC